MFRLPKIAEHESCEACVMGKQARQSFPAGRAWRASRKLQLIHADLCGPIQTKYLGGSRYFLLFVDDYSRLCWVYFLKHKDETFERLLKLKTLVEKQSGKSIKVLQTDRGGEFVSNQFTAYCEDQGIKRELTAPYSPQQNRVAERKNRTIMEIARSLLKHKRLPNGFWVEAMATAVHLINISPTKAVKNMTSYQAWRGLKPTVSHLRVFGCLAFSLIPAQHLKKLDMRSVKCIFIGYCLVCSRRR